MRDQNRFPTRFHIGTQKAGSTYLYNLLKSHPHTTMANKPKVCFFSGEYEKGAGWYQNLFEDTEYKIDTSPDYLKHSSTVPKRIYDFYEKPKGLRFVLILRNPIDYVASHFHMHTMHGHFEDNQGEYPRVPESLEEMQEIRPDYFNRGKYARLLDDWLEYFDKEQVKIFLFEEFIDNTDKVTTEMLEFWDIPEPDRKLKVNEVSQNSAMRSRWLYKLRGKIAKHEWLKERLKQSRLVNWIVDRFFNISPSSELSDEARTMLSDIFARDVKRLQNEWGIDTHRWRDF